MFGFNPAVEVGVSKLHGSLFRFLFELRNSSVQATLVKHKSKLQEE
jgi:hypothetical protein